MRLVSRGGLIAIALMVGALAAPTAQASSSAGSFNDPASTWGVVRPNPDEQVSVSNHSGSTPEEVTSSRDGAGQPRLRAAFAHAARTSGVSHTPDPPVASTPAQASADRIAAEHAAASPSAPLDRFSLIKVHTITPTPTPRVSTHSGSEGFHFGDAAIGAAVMVGLLLLGTAGVLAARRRREPVRP